MRIARVVENALVVLKIDSEYPDVVIKTCSQGASPEDSATSTVPRH